MISGRIPAARTGRPRAPRTLLTGPPGSGKTRALLAGFDAALAEAPEGALLLLPTYGQVEHEKRVALSRREDRADVRGLLDASYATFTSLGERFLEAFRVAQLPTRVERDLLAGEALARARVPAFESVADRPGFRSRFLRLVKEMKQTGDHDPAALRARARAAAEGLGDAPRERLLGFLAAWEEYDRLLLAADRPDHEDALRALLAHVRERPAGTAEDPLGRLRFLGVDGFDDLTGLEAALLDALADAVTSSGGTVVVTLPWDPARPDLFAGAKSLRDRLLSRGFVEEACEGFRRASSPGLVRLATRLFAEGDAAGDAPGDDVPADVRTLVGADPADEIERIAREILRLRDPERTDLVGRDGLPAPLAFRDVGIVYRRLDGFGTAARRVLESFGIPTRLVGTGERVASSPVVRALRGPLALWAGGDGVESAGPASGDLVDLPEEFPAALLLDYLRWRALGSGDPVPVAAVDAADLRWRREGYPADWPAFRADLGTPRSPEGGADDATRRALRRVLADLETARAACRAARGPGAVWDALRRAADALLPLPPPGGFDSDGAPLDPEGDERLRRASAAKSRFLALADGLRDAARRTGLVPALDAREAVTRWVEAAEEATAEPPDRRVDAVSLLDAEEARHWEMNVAFVAGLVERQFPLHPSQDVFLRDDDRERLLPGADASLRLPTAREAETRERRLFLSAATRARRRLYLTRHAAGDDGREKAPSFFWNDVEAAMGRPLAPPESPPEGTTPWRSHVPAAESVREGDLIAFTAAALGGLPAAVPAGLADGDRRLAVALALEGGPRVAALLRRADRFRRTGADPVGLEEVGVEGVRRFLAAVREVSPTQVTTALGCAQRHFLEYVAKVREDDVPFEGPRVDRRDVGRVVHDALRRAGERPAAAPEDVAREALEAADLLEGAERDFLAADLARIVRLFRARERAADGSGYATAGREVRFGSAAGTPVVLGEGDSSFRLEGRIDRLDVREEDGVRRAVVVDYKLSRTSSDAAYRDTRSHADLQLALYARAVERLHGVDVVALELYAALVRHRRILCDETYAGEMAERAEGARPAALKPQEFRRLVADAEALAMHAVETVRSGTTAALARAPLDPDDCEACPYLGVCRPDVARLRAGAAERDAEAAGAPVRAIPPGGGEVVP